ncbi:ArsR/SmtB family transcription factor [Pontibacter beigongshangensis]|uniref:ArsR/SmtB family transcription factor n=1 Tax=Pontibacter beigongshangensis TaxID=2574733 RepID=UPI00164F84C4|nr:metalloregulator ArsR/SmtB family transcription factor [Pontibacter beigongshangensis]
MNKVEIFKALSNKTRLQILNMLREPDRYFPPQQAGDSAFGLGVCVGHIQQKLGLSQSTVSEYLATLQRAGLITATRSGQWTYYKRDEAAIQRLGETIRQEL